MKYMDRRAAGRQLAGKLAHLKEKQPVVLALPRGGVAVGFEIAEALDAPLDIVLVRKIGVPWQPELALGAVTDGASVETFIDRHLVTGLGIPEDYVKTETEQQLQEIERRRNSTAPAGRRSTSPGVPRLSSMTASPLERRCGWRCVRSGAGAQPDWS